MTNIFRFIIKEKGKCAIVKNPPRSIDHQISFAKELIEYNPNAEIVAVTVYGNEVWATGIEMWIMEQECYIEMARHDKEQAEADNKVLADIQEWFGKAYCRNVKACLKECEFGGGLQIVEMPRGKKQLENWKSFKHIYVEQWSVGIEGDSYAGYISIPLPDKKFLQFYFSC